MDKNRKFIAAAICLLLMVPTLICAECFNYEPDSVSLTGKIIERTFPGRPNYESIKAGDEPETYWILNIAKAFCVNAKADEPSYSLVSDIKQVQLVFMGDEYRKYKNLVGKKVIVHGQLFPMQTGHHHTRVLMIVKELQRNNK